MNETSTKTVTLTRESLGVYVATNEAGATLRFGPKPRTASAPSNSCWPPSPAARASTWTT